MRSAAAWPGAAMHRSRISVFASSSASSSPRPCWTRAAQFSTAALDDGPVVPNACASIAGRAAPDIDRDAGPARRDDAPQEREGQQARAARTDVAAEPEEARGAGVGVLLEPVFVFDFGHSSYVVFWGEHLLQEL